RVARNDGHDPRSHDLRDAIHRHLELTGNHLVDFLLRMEVLVDGRPGCELVVGECHGGRMEEAALPTSQPFDDDGCHTEALWRTRDIRTVTPCRPRPHGTSAGE